MIDWKKNQMVMIDFDKSPFTAFQAEARIASLRPTSLPGKVNSWKKQKQNNQKTEFMSAKE